MSAEETQDQSVMLEQSPIDICQIDVHALPTNPEDIKIVLDHVDADIVRHGVNFHVQWQHREGNYLTIDGKVYHTIQFHFHTPSMYIISSDVQSN